MEYRKVFDTIPEQFDKFRLRYSSDHTVDPGARCISQDPGAAQTRRDACHDVSYRGLQAGKRVFNADEYVKYCGTHSDHMVIPEPYKSKFFDGLHKAVLDAGDRVEFRDTYVLYTVRKP